MKPRKRDEDGAVAVLVALLAVTLLTFAAFSVDISTLVDQHQKLYDTLDTAALSGAMLLPDATAAKAQALAVAHNNDPDATPAVVFFCVVGAMGTTPPVVDPLGIPGSCNPGPAPYTATTYPGLRCTTTLCAIPCFPDEGDSCNALKVVAKKDVPFVFGPVVGVRKGSTGPLGAIACKGGCGSPVVTPIDLAIIADRTSSMSPAAFLAVKTGVQGMLKMFDPANTQVAFGMNSVSKTALGCATHPATSNTDGQWFPISSGGSALFKDYVIPGSKPPVLNPVSPLVTGITCMTQSSGIGTWLAAPIDAAEELLRTDTKRNPTAKKAIFYMTDGDPNENYTATRQASGRNVVTSTKKAWGNTTATTACTNASTAATDAKTAGVTVVTIAYDVSTSTCGTKKLLDQLASMASPIGGVPSTSNGCDTTAKVTAENADGDYFFCAAQPSDLASIFQTAAVTIAGGSRLIWMP
jgi:putative Flp pilus-assembly TadE/G-like protein